MGGVKCWGRNVNGQLGDNSTTDSLTPVDVFGLSVGITEISAGNNHTCALNESGGVKCWGVNSFGQIGDGSTTSRLVPTAVTGLSSGVSMISLGAVHSCALTELGGVKCWGSNFQGRLSQPFSMATAEGLSGISLIEQIFSLQLP